jgi:hypothetical protein
MQRPFLGDITLQHVHLEKTALYLNCVGKLLSVIVSSSPSSTSSDIFLFRLGRSCSCRLASCIQSDFSPVRIAGFLSCLARSQILDTEVCNVGTHASGLSASPSMKSCSVMFGLI